MVDYFAIVILTAAVAAFLLNLSEKWGWREWLMVHAPNETLYNLFLCRFCCTWWTLVIVSIINALIVRDAALLAVPFFATPIAFRLW